MTAWLLIGAPGFALLIGATWWAFTHPGSARKGQDRE